MLIVAILALSQEPKSTAPAVMVNPPALEAQTRGTSEPEAVVPLALELIPACTMVEALKLIALQK